MQRKFIFKDADKEVILPITPPSFSIGKGNNIETINIHALGDVILAGYGTLATIQIDCMLPAKEYPFSFSTQEPYSLVDEFSKWIDDKKIIRFVISDTPINIAVLMQSIEYSETDGTNDVYASITLREYRELSIVKVSTMETQNKPRITVSPPVKSSSYTIVKGDTLSSICRKFYGNANLYSKLAKVNNIKNPNLIYAGNTLKIPDINQL